MKNLTRNSSKNEKQPKALTFFTCNISAFNIWTRSIVKLKETKKVAVCLRLSTKQAEVEDCPLLKIFEVTD